MTPMAEEEEDHNDIFDLFKSNTERNVGDPYDASYDNAEAFDTKYGNRDNADIDGPNSDDEYGPMMILPRPIIQSQILLKPLTLI